MKRTARFNDTKKPLISIVLHNNSDEYLRQCFDSILNQTYDNIEICFYDYASSDKSWDIAVEYQQNNPGIITLLRLRKDYLLDTLVNNLQNVRGKYFMRFHTSCAMQPELVEKGINALESNYDVAFATIRKTILNDAGDEIAETPLYNESCVIPGIDHIPNHLTSNPPPSSSISIFNTDIAKLDNSESSYVNESFLSLKYNMVYINEPLFLYRENKRIFLPGETKDLTHLFNLYSAKVNFIKKLYFINDMNEITDKLSEVLRILSKLSLSHCILELINKNEMDAKKFFYLSATIDLNIETDDTFINLQEYWGADNDRKLEIIEILKPFGEFEENTITFPLPQRGKLLKT